MCDLVLLGATVLTIVSKLRVEQSRIVQDHQRQLEHVQKTAEANADQTRKRMEAEIADLQRNISKLEADLSKVKIVHPLYERFWYAQANKNHVQDLQTAHDEYTASKNEQAARLQRTEEKAEEFERRSEAASAKAAKAELSLAENEKGKQTVQSELDDLLMVFGDLEDKVTKYRERLKALGESISDDEEDEDEDGEDEVDWNGSHRFV